MVSFQFKVLAVLSCAICIQSFQSGHNIVKRTNRLAAIQSDNVNKVAGFGQFDQMFDLSNDDNTLDKSSAHMPALSDMQISALVLAAAVLFMPTEPAQALEGGIFAKKFASMIHPVTNFALFGTSLYSAYLGLKWRKIRDLGTEIKALNGKLPMLSTGRASLPLTSKIDALTAEAATAEDVSTINKDLAALKSAFGLAEEIQAKQDDRKSMIADKPKDKHELTGSFLLGGGVSVSLLGALNTYMRAGKLFPGPHLYAGMAIVILWAVAAALVPQMQKGNEGARVAHIVCNFANIALFAWQIPTGLQIMWKVIEKTPW